MVNKKKRCLLIAIVVLSAVFAFSACGGPSDTSTSNPTSDSTSDTSEEPITSEVVVSIDKKKLSLDLHELQTLNAAVENSTDTVVWASSNPSVATVSETGEVRSVSVGTAVITASIGDVKDSCDVEVYNSGAAPVMEVNYSSPVVGKGDSLNIIAQAMYKNSPLIDPVEYKWEAGEGAEEFIKYTVDGGMVTVEGIAEGSTSLVVSSDVYGVKLAETIEITVRNLDVTFEITGLEAGAGAYTTNLSTLETEKDKTEVSPEIIVYNKGEIISDAVITWEVADDSIVSVENGVFTALKAGTTTVLGTYKDSSFTVIVNVYRPELKIDSKIELESMGSGKLDLSILSEEVEGEVIGVYSGNSETNLFISHNMETGEVEYNSSLLPTAIADLGPREIVLETQLARYISDGGVYTSVIRTPDDLDGWFAISKQCETASNKWGGYFVLGNDIDYTGREYTPKYPSFAVSDFRAGGFVGIFDGQNHTIKGFHTVGERSGLVGWVGPDGIIRNISFVDAIQEGNGSLIASTCIGHIENIYVSVSVEAKEGSWGIGSSVIASDMMVETRISKVLVEYIDRTGDATSGYPLWAYHKTFNILSGGMYAVGVDKLWSYLGTEGGDTDTYGAYETYAELQAANIDFSGWENDFWTVKNGLPYPKNFGNDIEVGLSSKDVAYPLGTEFKIEKTRYTDLALDSAAIEAGFKLKGNVVTIPKNTDLRTFTVTATSSLDSSKKVSKTFSVLESKVLEIEESFDLDVYHMEDTFTIDLSEYKEDIVGDEITATINGKNFATADYESATGIVTLDKASLGKLFGNQSIVLSIRKMENGLPTFNTTVNLDVRLASMIIKTADDLDAFMGVAKTYDDREGGYSGLFLLGNDIDYTGREYTPKFPSYDVKDFRSGGFVGIFDGQNHTINGFHTVGDRSGLIGWLGPEGIIQNVSFINAIQEGNGALISPSCIGTVKNIYVSVFVNAGTGVWGLGPSVFGSDLLPESRFEKVFVEYIGRTGNMESGYPLWVYYPNYDILSGGMYAVGVDKLWCDGSVGEGENTYGAYATYADLQAAKVDFSGWENDFWTVKNGLPYPKGFETEVVVKISNTQLTCTAGTKVKIEVTPYTDLALDEEAIAAGFTLSGDIVTIPSETTLKTFTVTATSSIEPDKKTSVTFTIT